MGGTCNKHGRYTNSSSIIPSEKTTSRINHRCKDRVNIVTCRSIAKQQLCKQATVQ
jgi:hypothetical protein